MRATVAFEKIRNIAIYDDQQDSRDSISEAVQDCGFVPHPIDKPFHTLDECLYNMQRYDAALFDHRLSEGNFGNFKGAEVVRELYRKNFPALLVSAWTEGDPEDALYVATTFVRSGVIEITLAQDPI